MNGDGNFREKKKKNRRLDYKIKFICRELRLMKKFMIIPITQQIGVSANDFLIKVTLCKSSDLFCSYA